MVAEVDKVKTILKLGELEHDEEKVIYQFMIGAIVSISIGFLIGIFQGQIKLENAVLFLIGFYEFALFFYLKLRQRLEKIRMKISEDIKKLEVS